THTSVSITRYVCFIYLFDCKHPSTTNVYTLSLHDALPICIGLRGEDVPFRGQPLLDGQVVLDDAVVDDHERARAVGVRMSVVVRDRKSTRLNSSHLVISYAVFCLKKKKQRTSYSSLVAHAS